MKKIYLFLTAIVLLTTACKKDNSNVYYIEAKIDGQTWEAVKITTFYTTPTTKDTILVTSQTDNTYFTLQFVKAKNRGTSYISPTDYHANYSIAGTTASSFYTLGKDATNSLVITSYDEATQTISGTFNLSFDQITNSAGPATGKLVLSSGSFRVKIPTGYIMYYL